MIERGDVASDLGLGHWMRRRNLCPRKDGVVELRPENPAFPPITFSDGQELAIWGVVVGVVY